MKEVLLPSGEALPKGPRQIDADFHTLREFSELSSDWFWEQDAEFRFTRVFGLSTELLRRKQSEFFGKRRWDLPIRGITPEQLAQHIDAHLRHQPFRNFEYEVPGDDGSLQYYSISGTPVFDEGGVFAGYHGIGRNITEVRLAEAQIRNSERQLSQILDVSLIPTFVLDIRHRVTHWNQACANITGLQASEMLGKADVWRAFYGEARLTIADLLVDAATEQQVAAYYPKSTRSRLTEGGFEAINFLPQMGQGGRWLFLTAVPLRDANGALTGAIETLQDVTEQQRTQALLEQLASHDGLTAVANRRSFDETLAAQWRRAQRESATLSLLMIDVDHFKRYNDQYGHQAGDRCLQAIAGALAKVVGRPGDLLARYGGEEFAVILASTGEEGAVMVAQRVLEAAAALAIAHDSVEGKRVTVSVGVATVLPELGVHPETLIASADQALYQAKHAGRNRYCVHRPQDVLSAAAADGDQGAPGQEMVFMPVDTRAMWDFVQLSSDWFWAQDEQFRFTRFFGQAPERLQREPGDFLGKRRWDMPIHGVTPQQLAQHIEAHEQHRPFRDFAYEIPSAQGETQYFSVSGMPVFRQDGSFAGYHGMGRNITELRQAELATADSERRLSEIVNGSPIPTFVIDVGHRVTHWNQACALLTGIEAQAMIGSRDAWRAFYAQPRATMADLVADGAADPNIALHYPGIRHSNLLAGAIEAEHFFPQLGEGGRWLYFTAAPLRDTAGKLTGAIETLQDITLRRRAEDLLNERTQALSAAHAELERRVAERTRELSQQLHFLQQLIEAIPGPVYYKDSELRYLGCNSAYQQLTGLSGADLIGKTPHDIAPSEQADGYVASDRRLLQQPGSQIYESQLRDASGDLRDVMFHKATFTRDDGSVGGLVGVILDITERRQMEDRLRQASTVFDSSAQGVTIATPEGIIIAVNRAFTEITGYDEGEVVGRNSRMLQSGRHDPDFYRQMWGSLAAQGRWQGEIWNRRKSGEAYPEWLSIAAVRDQQGRLTNYVATFSDISEQKQTQERVQLLAFSDPLTGLPNRRLLLDRLQHALVTSLRSNRHGALLLIDLDDFKGLNDTRGHPVGDLLLKQVAQRLVDCVREGDTVARFGGDEFVVMLEDLGDNALEATHRAEAVGAKIAEALGLSYVLLEHVHHITPSMGVTLFGDHQGSVEDLLKQAEMAMYRAKGSGRNTLRFFDPEMQAALAARVALETDLRQGLLNEQFLLHYQPQVDHRSRVTGAEALVRWNHPERGLVAPASFIPLVEETKLILPLGQWVLMTACRQLAQWARRAETAHLTMSVNVSARQFRQPDFVAQVRKALNSQAIGPGKLKLELTESLLLDDVEGTVGKMVELKGLGVSLSLDDFGTGYSSLSYLKRLPLDQLKIDQSFVRDVLVDPNDAAIACTIVALAHSLGLGVIAEGVETEEQLLFLAANNCHAYQGYLFSRPLPQDAFLRFVLDAAARGVSD